MKRVIFLAGILVGTFECFSQDVVYIGPDSIPPYAIFGKIFDASSEEALPGVNIYLEKENIAITSDSEGSFSLYLDKGTYTLQVSIFGYDADTTTIRVFGEGKIDFSLTPKIKQEAQPFSTIGSAPTTVGIQARTSKFPYKLKGKVIDGLSGESLPGANIYIEKQNIGTSTDLDGDFKLSLYKGLYTISVSSLGYQTETKRYNIIGPAKINFLLNEEVTELDEVVVQGGARNDAVNRQVGKEVLSIASIKALPPLAGEADVLKALTLLPGVSSPGEASGGFNVRGGGYDQNLVLVDGAPLYNPSHMFGFFSAFNPNIIRDVTLYKGAIPANYGGRGSSVVDIAYKRGSLANWAGDVTVGMVSSKFSAGGPIIPDKMSVMLGGRASYTNWLLRQAGDADVQNSRASFYDGNVLLNYAINPKNDVSYSLYYSSDSFRFAGDTTNEWQNVAQVVKWNSELSEKLTLQLSALQSDYQSTITSDIPFAGFDLESGILDNQIGAELTLKPLDNHTIIVGGQTKWLTVNLGSLEPFRDSFIEPENITKEKATESGLFLQHDFDIFKNLTVSYGVRWSNFRRMGAGLVNSYDPSLSRDVANVSGQTTFGDGELIQSYSGIEPRASLNLKLGAGTSLKAGYNRMNQYIHLISNTTSISPIDVWKLSDPFLKPEIVDQYSFGIFKNLQGSQFEASIEGYYKDWDNVVEYKDGADLFLNSHLETELLTGLGKSYGVETLFKKKNGRFNGWISYTYSRSLRKIDGPLEEERLNDGRWYASNFDKPHNFTMVARYRLGPFMTLSTIFTFNSGRPVTLPNGKFSYQGENIAYFNDRNGGRIPDYHRMDLSLQYESPSRKKLLSGTWTFSVYNLYGRQNAFSVYFKDTFGAPPQAFKLSVIGVPFPSLSYELKF